MLKLRQSLNTLLLITSLLLLFSGCYYDVEEELYPPGAQSCDTNAVSYMADVAPIMSRSCTSCHSGSSPSAGIALSDYTNVRLYGEGGSLLGSVTHDPNYSAMPKGGSKLDDCSINKIKAWASQGYRN